MSEFKFVVDPCEDEGDRETRWDKALLELQSSGYTIRGTGPDGDEPIRFETDESDLAGPYTEVYEVVSL